jgi:molybdate transport system substrate-binding protein
MDGAAADDLGRRGLVRADSKVVLARSLIGIVVRAGAAKPDIGSVEALRSTLLAANLSHTQIAAVVPTYRRRYARHR